MPTALASAHVDQEAVAFYAHLPTAMRREWELLEDAVRRIHDAPRGQRGRVIAEIAAECAGVRGLTEKSLRRKYDTWLRAGQDARALLNRAKLPRRHSNAAVHECYKTYCERNQRKSLPAWRSMMQDLAAGEVLPHVGHWTTVYRHEHGEDAELPPFCPYNVDCWPEGWSYPNLQAIARLSDYERAASRVGGAAAREFALPVITTRVGLACGQIFQFDDKWHDAEVNFPGQSGSIRPLEFACYDVFSARKVAFALRPRTVNEDGTRDNLKEREMRWLVSHLLTHVGFHKAGCKLQVEHGTAAVRQKMADRLSRLSGGRVTVERPGIVGEAVHAGMWPGAGGGNPCFKALTESLHGLDHNELALLPGQIGMDRAHHPEQFARMSDYNQELIKALAVLPEPKRRQILSPFLPWHTYCQLVGEIYDRIEDRKWHHLEGWDEAGLVVCEYQMAANSNWYNVDTLLDLPHADRQAIEAFLRAHPELKRTRRLSPREVWQRGRGELDRLSKYLLPDMLEREDGFPIAPASNGVIAFQDQYLGPGRHVFFANVTTPSGYRQDLTPGRTYRAFITPYNVDELFITDDSNGVVLGIAPRYNKACKLDMDAIHALQGAQKHDIAVRNAEIATRHEPEAAARAALLAHNAPLLAAAQAPGHPIPPAPPADPTDTAAERARARSGVNVIASINDEGV